MVESSGSVVTHSMKTMEFLAGVRELVRMQLPVKLRDPQMVDSRGPLVKLFYSDPTIHYEVWVRKRDRVVEVGLHFEGPTESNTRYLDELTGRYPHIIGALGPQVEAERWTGSWTRVHQVVPFDNLDEDTLMVVSGCLAQMMIQLEPVIRKIERYPE